MKKIFTLATTVLFVLTLIVFPAGSVSAKQAEINLPYRVLESAGKQCKDPGVPCYGKTFSSATVNSSTASTPLSVISTVTYTCGVNVYDAFNVKVATLSENATVRWRTDGFDITGASRSTWVKTPSIYYWYGISGPSGLGSYGTAQMGDVNTSAQLVHLAIYAGTGVAHLTFSYDRNWTCRSSYP